MSDTESDEIKYEYSSDENELDLDWSLHFQDILNNINSDISITPKMRNWIYSQFSNLEKNNDILSKKRLESLLSINHIKKMYDSKMNRTTWNENYHELKIFIEKNNRLPKISENKKLLTWLRHQKENILSGKYDNINNFKKQKLLQSKYISDFIKRKKLCFWNERYSQLLEFIKFNNQLPSNSTTSLPYEKRLSKWLTLQLQLIRGHCQWNIKDERKELLLKIDLVRNRLLN